MVKVHVEYIGRGVRQVQTLSDLGATVGWLEPGLLPGWEGEVGEKEVVGVWRIGTLS